MVELALRVREVPCSNPRVGHDQMSRSDQIFHQLRSLWPHTQEVFATYQRCNSFDLVGFFFPANSIGRYLRAFDLICAALNMCRIKITPRSQSPVHWLCKWLTQKHKYHQSFWNEIHCLYMMPSLVLIILQAALPTHCVLWNLHQKNLRKWFLG